MKYWFYSIIAGIARFLVAILYPVRCIGNENLPAEGGAIMCMNHISLLDPVLVACGVKHRHINFMAKAELFKLKPVAAFFKALGVIPVNRGKSDMGALRASMAVCSNGHVLGIFSQGHRDKTGSLEMEAGVALIALRTKTAVIPVRISGNHRLFHRVYIHIGEQVDLSGFQGKHDSGMLKSVTSLIEDAVWALPEGNTK